MHKAFKGLIQYMSKLFVRLFKYCLRMWVLRQDMWPIVCTNKKLITSPIIQRKLHHTNSLYFLVKLTFVVRPLGELVSLQEKMPSESEQKALVK